MGGQEHGKVRRFSYQPKQPGKSSHFSSGGRSGRGRFGVLYLFPGPAVTKHCRPETAGMHSLSIPEAPGKDPSCLFQLLVAPGSPCCLLAPSCVLPSLPLSSCNTTPPPQTPCVFLCPDLLPLMRTAVTGLGPVLTQSNFTVA